MRLTNRNDLDLRSHNFNPFGNSILVFHFTLRRLSGIIFDCLHHYCEVEISFDGIELKTFRAFRKLYLQKSVIYNANVILYNVVSRGILYKWRASTGRFVRFRFIEILQHVFVIICRYGYM